MSYKTVDTISVGDFKLHPVWKYRRGRDMTIAPEKKLPCTSLDGRIVGTQVELADRTMVWAFLGNIDTANPAFSEHFLTLSIDVDGNWFHLARYHDIDYSRNGPSALSKRLGKSIDEVFPITYDIGRVFNGESDALKGKIEKEPRNRLTRDEIIAMAVP